MKQVYLSLAFIILFQLVTILFFVLSKNILNLDENFFTVFIPWVYHSPLLVPLMMLASFGLTFWSIATFANNSSVFRRYRFKLTAWSGLLFLSILPLGNWIKHNLFFFEHWMWLCAIWFHFSMITLLSISFGLMNAAEINQSHVNNSSKYFWKWNEKKVSQRNLLFVGSAFFWVVFVSLFLGEFVLGGIPHVQDSIAQLFQAKIFALGKWSLSIPNHSEFFERIYTVMKDGRWYSIYPPGYAMVLSIGVWLHTAQWVNPLLSGCIVLLTFIIAKKIYDTATARLTILFLLISPFFIFMASGWMNHPTALFFAMLFWYCLIQCGNASGMQYYLWIVGAGAAHGMMFLTRPITAIAFLFFGILWMALHQKQIFLRLMSTLVCFALGTLPFAVFYLLYNANTTGHLFLTGYVDYFGGNPLGFGKQPWGAEPLGPKIPNEVLHTPWRGFANTICNINGLNYYLFGFPVPSLLFAFLLFLPGTKRTKTDWLCLFPLTGISALYFFYFFQDYCYGPRFVYESVPFLCMLSARGLFSFVDWLQEHMNINKEKAVRGMTIFVILCIVYSFSVVWAERIINMSDDYWSTQDDTLDLAEQIVPEDEALFFTEMDEDFAAFFSMMDPRLDRGWIVAHDLGERKNQTLMQAYPQWPVYSVHLQPNDTSSGFKTVIEPYTRSVIGP